MPTSARRAMASRGGSAPISRIRSTAASSRRSRLRRASDLTEAEYIPPVVTVWWDEVDRSATAAAATLAVVGGKGAQLARLSQIDGIRVPAWFCVTTAAYRRIVAGVPSLDGLVDELSQVA